MSGGQSVLLVDAGTGNLHSVHNALVKLGAEVTLTSDPEVVRGASKVVLPGVGAFGAFVAGLEKWNLGPALADAAGRGVPILGICVGMQALFEVSEEMGRFVGLGLLPGRVVRFAEMPGVKVPHTGWNQLFPCGEAALFAGLPAGCHAYFNHSYYCAPAGAQYWAARTDYGEPFASAVQWENLYGVQFHPEKSQQVGLRVLENFLAIGGE